MCKKEENLYRIIRLVRFLFITFIASSNIFAFKIVWFFDIFLDYMFFFNFLNDFKVLEM